MACASLFLNLPIYTETGLPWDPDTILDDGDPNFEKPDYEISFPPAVVRLDDAYELEDSIRAQELPRAIDRGKYDIESVTVSHLSSCEWPATIGVTSDFLSSTKQSRLIARQRMLADQRISKVSHLNKAEPPKFFIELAKPGYMNDSINMSQSPDLRSPKDKKPFFSNARDVSYDEIRSAGHSLMPSRYMTKGPAGGNGIVEVIRNEFKEKKFNLSELFEVIRPKETKNAAEGTLEIQELRAGNITPNGEIEGRLRNVSIRATRMPSLDEQVVKAGDILLAHRGSIGHVAYITETDNTNIGLWAGQTLFILRERKLTSSSKSKIYCDPRVLFMYLLTPKVHEHWRSILTGDKNPSIPIGEVESLGLPENIVLPTKPRRGISPKNVKGASGYVEQVIFDFEKRQAMLLQVRELQKDMDDGLKRVWDTAWKKQIEKSDE